MQVWRSLGSSWAIQNVFGGILDCLGSVLEGLGGVLEASWAVFGRERWPTWFQLGFQNEVKIAKKSIKHVPTIYHKSSKIEVWRAPVQVWRRLGPSWAIQSVFGGILDCLGSVLEASWRGLGGLLGGLWPRKVANMAPTWPPKRSQNQLKIDPKIDQFVNAS